MQLSFIYALNRNRMGLKTSIICYNVIIISNILVSWSNHMGFLFLRFLKNKYEIKRETTMDTTLYSCFNRFLLTRHFRYGTWIRVAPVCIYERQFLFISSWLQVSRSTMVNFGWLSPCVSLTHSFNDLVDEESIYILILCNICTLIIYCLFYINSFL